MGRLLNQTALAPHAYCREDIIARAHNTTDSCTPENTNDTGRLWFELVFKDDEAKEIEIAFGFFALHLLSLDPAELGIVLCCTGNDTVAAVGVVGKELFVVFGD
jgi:hypothetical protein